jgi:hypothetical protein
MHSYAPPQSIRRQRSGRHPSDTHSTDSGGDGGGGPGRLLGAAAAEYTAGLRASRRSNSISDDTEVTSHPVAAVAGLASVS